MRKMLLGISVDLVESFAILPTKHMLDLHSTRANMDWNLWICCGLHILEPNLLCVCVSVYFFFPCVVFFCVPMLLLFIRWLFSISRFEKCTSSSHPLQFVDVKNAVKTLARPSVGCQCYFIYFDVVNILTFHICFARINRLIIALKHNLKWIYNVYSNVWFDPLIIKFNAINLSYCQSSLQLGLFLSSSSLFRLSLDICFLFAFIVSY